MPTFIIEARVQIDSTDLQAAETGGDILRVDIEEMYEVGRVAVYIDNVRPITGEEN